MANYPQNAISSGKTLPFLPHADPANHQKMLPPCPEDDMCCKCREEYKTHRRHNSVYLAPRKGKLPSLRPTPPQKPFSSQNAVILRCTERDNDPVPVIRLIQHMESFFVKTAHDAKKPPYSPTKRHKSTFPISNIKQRTLLMNSE